jgi:hypothetical protein
MTPGGEIEVATHDTVVQHPLKSFAASPFQEPLHVPA